MPKQEPEQESQDSQPTREVPPPSTDPYAEPPTEATMQKYKLDPYFWDDLAHIPNPYMYPGGSGLHLGGISGHKRTQT